MAQRSCFVDDCDRPVSHAVICLTHWKRLRRNGHLRELTAVDRFMNRVTEDDRGCWNFSYVDAKTGYASFADNKVKWLAHRWAYTYFRAEIPDGLEIDHLCSNRACVNPWHLEPVTHRVNTLRGVGSRENCVNNHPYDASNTTIRPNGHRQCRTCARDAQRRYYENRSA